jgi:hypothetical protein
VRVAHVHAGDASNQVDVLLALGVINKLLLPLDRVEGLFVVMSVKGKDVVPQSFDLIICFPGVGSRAH